MSQEISLQIRRMLSVAGALVSTAAWEEAQEARLWRRVLRVRRLSALLQRFWSASAASWPVSSPKKQRRATSKSVHGPAFQGTVVLGKYISPCHKIDHHVTEYVMKKNSIHYLNHSTLPIIISFSRRFYRWCQFKKIYTMLIFWNSLTKEILIVCIN